MSAGRPHLAPHELLDELTSLALRPFLAYYGDTPLLVVRIAAGDTDLELGLDTGADRPAAAKPLPFRTTDQAPPRGARRSVPPKSSPRAVEAQAEERARVASFLRKNACVAVRLQKRGNADAVFGHISVGRAQNKDIVLRHQSISKFHAWFEVDPSLEVRVSDSGSTNRTLVNGRPIEPKTSVVVASGDLVQFGAVEAILCSPETLWWCVNQRDEADAASR